MSIEAMTWARKVKGLTPTQKLLLLLLADHASQQDGYGEDFVCWPKQELLAADANVSKRTVIRSLAEMEELGLIERRRRHRSDGSRAADLYVCNLDVSGDRRQGDRLSGDTDDASKVTLVSPQETKEEPKEVLPLAPLARRSDDDEVHQFALIAEPLTPSVPQKRSRPATPERKGVLPEYIVWRREQGAGPMPQTTIARIGKIIKEAIASGISEATIAAALRQWHERGRSPASLPTFIDGEARKKGKTEKDNWMFQNGRMPKFDSTPYNEDPRERALA